MTEEANSDSTPPPAASATPEPEPPASHTTIEHEPHRAQTPRQTPPALILAGIFAVLLVLGGAFLVLSGVLPSGRDQTRNDAAISELKARLGDAEQARRAAEERLQRLEQQLPAAASHGESTATALSALADRVAALEQHPPPAAVSGDAAALHDQLQEAIGQFGSHVADLDGKIAALDVRSGELEAKLPELGARLEQDETRLDKLAVTAVPSTADADRVLLLAIAELRGAAEASQPFAGALGAVAAAARERSDLAADLATLQSPAAKGLPSLALLTERFQDETASAILRAAAAATPANADWGERVLARLRSLVVIRRVDGGGAGPADATSAAVERAQAALRQGDLAGAVGALGSLSGPPAQVAASWLDLARQRLTAEQALSDLTERVTAHLASATHDGETR